MSILARTRDHFTMMIVPLTLTLFRVASFLTQYGLGQSQNEADEYYDDCDLHMFSVFSGCPCFTIVSSGAISG